MAALWRAVVGQPQAVDFTLERVRPFSEDPSSRIEVPSFGEAVGRAIVGYDGESTVKALPCVLAELAPGLSAREHAATLEALDFVDSDVAEWLEQPARALLPEMDWPDLLPRSRANMQSQAEWEQLAVHLVGFGILATLAPAELVSVRGPG